MLKEHPGYFAAGISICGATSKKGLDFLTRVPLWLIHAVDDEIVKATYRDKMTGDLYHYGSKDIYEFGFRKAEDWHYTELPAGYMKEHYRVNPHCSWVVMSDEKNEQMGEWLFSR